MHGLSAGAWWRFNDASYVHYEVDRPGHKSNMTDVQAAIGIRQLERLDSWIDRRADRWDAYDDLLAALDVERPPRPLPGTRHARHLYRILTRRDGASPRDDVIARMSAAGIGTGVHYRGVHLHRYYRERYGLDPAAFPVATDMSERTLSLPLSPAITAADQRRVAEALRGAIAA